jgi:hypothetical protein
MLEVGIAVSTIDPEKTFASWLFGSWGNPTADKETAPD